MIITRTPFRVSFFGGGTDYPTWYREHGGAVLSTSINKYSYITCRPLPPFFDHKHRIVYSRIENASSTEEIGHPAVKAVLQWANVEDGLEIHHDGDLPARSGLGSSSAFTVGLTQAIYALRKQEAAPQTLARDAIHIEQNVIGESVGSQDQISAAYGGFNCIRFHTDNSFDVVPLQLDTQRKEVFRDHLMLCFTGVSRIADAIAQSQIENMTSRQAELKRMLKMVDEGISILNSNSDIEDFGRLLDEFWRYKRSLSNKVSTHLIDQLYEAARDAGAIGGKILGAGGGGFMLLFARPEDHQRIRERLNNLIHVDFNYDNSGCRIIMNHPNEH